MIVWEFLCWLFSNSGAIRGNPDAQSHYIFARAKKPLMHRDCPYCKRVYWAFTRYNNYCGRFACYRSMIRRHE
jgi:hypothetical protein